MCCLSVCYLLSSVCQSNVSYLLSVNYIPINYLEVTVCLYAIYFYTHHLCWLPVLSLKAVHAVCFMLAYCHLSILCCLSIRYLSSAYCMSGCLLFAVSLCAICLHFFVCLFYLYLSGFNVVCFLTVCLSATRKPVLDSYMWNKWWYIKMLHCHGLNF